MIYGYVRVSTDRQDCDNQKLGIIECDLYKVGLESGKKYNAKELLSFVYWTSGSNKPFYFKDSLLQQAGISREDLPANCVDKDYNIFNNKYII
jgi:hypothetical protein